MRRYAFLVLLLLPCVFAQAPEFALDRAGRWTVQPADFPSDLPADARPRLTQTLNEVIAALRKMPTLAQPRGLEVTVTQHGEWQDLDSQSDTRRPKFAGAAVTVEIAAYHKDAKPKEPPVYVAVLHVGVNDLSLFAGWESGHGVSTDDADARFLIDPPEPFAMHRSWPIYHDWNERGSWVVMTRAKVPIFAPVPRERYLQYEIGEAGKVAGRQMRTLSAPPSNDPAVVAAWKEAQKRMAEIQQTFDEGKAHVQAQLDGLNKQLAEMPPADRRAPAYLSSPNPTDEGKIDFLQRGDSDAKAVVYRNPGTVNDRLPRGTPQVLTVWFEPSDEWPDLAPKLEQEFDWSSLEKILAAP